MKNIQYKTKFRFYSVIIFIFCSVLLNAQEVIQLGNISVKIPSNISFTWLNGDTEERESYNNEFQDNGNFHLLYFKKIGDSHYSYSPRPEHIESLEAYLSGTSDEKPNIWSNALRKSYFKNFGINVLDGIIIGIFEPEDVRYNRLFTFTDDEYCYSFGISFSNQKEIMPIEMPDYFFIHNTEKHSRLRWVGEKREELLNSFKNNMPLPEYFESLISESTKIFTDSVIINNK